MREWKTDTRPMKGMWAPGDYVHTRCRSCEDSFIGDKYARECADCAYSGKPEQRALEAFDPGI
jgi:hypothetical protein